ncbi:MAG: hypothetical protein VKJ24_13385 [Synechococcales bacterium]|nr:hypothetical protein [Synechococcales bacterium]
MNLRLATLSDCFFFKFWYGDRILGGINCQGEIFVQLQTFPTQRQDRAYEVGSLLAAQVERALLIKGKDQYILGATLRGQGWLPFLVDLQE